MSDFKTFDNENTCPHCGKIIPDDAWHDNEAYGEDMFDDMDYVEQTEYMENPDWIYDATCPHCGKSCSKQYRTKLVYDRTLW